MEPEVEPEDEEVEYEKVIITQEEIIYKNSTGPIKMIFPD